MNQPFRTLFRFTVAATSVAIMTASRATAQDNVVQGQIPDFYQHQGDNGGIWPGTGGAVAPTSNSPSANGIWSPDRGWCAYVADMDALYPWENLTVLGAKPYDNNNQWLFGNPAAAANPGTGTALTGAGTWVGAADDTVIPALRNTPVGANGTINSYLAAQKVDPGSLGLGGLVDTQYRVQAGGQVQVSTIAGWQNIATNTFQTYQQLTSAGSNLAAGLQPLAAITTTIRLNYTPTNGGAFPGGGGTTGFWWGFHQVAGAGTAGANTIQYSDPDAIPINAGNRNGGFTQAAVNANQYTAAQQAAAAPLPGNGAYNAGNLYSTMVVDAQGRVTGGNGPYATGLKAAAAPVSRIVAMDAVSLPAVQIVNNIAQAGFNLLKFAFTGNFGGKISKLEIFSNSQLANAANNFGLSENDPNWNISTVTQDPFGNDWSGYAGIALQEGTGGQDLMESGTSYLASLDTTSAASEWTVYAFDSATGTWLTETYGAPVGFGNADQITAIPEPSTYAGLLGLATLAFAAIRRRRQIRI